jgi:hypothetical protein
MSHFTTIKTQIKDIASLRSACAELGLAVKQNSQARGYYENKTKGDYVIQLKGPYDIALNQRTSGRDMWKRRSVRAIANSSNSMASTRPPLRPGRKGCRYSAGYSNIMGTRY